jgi:small subunit ribosomal protein S18
MSSKQKQKKKKKVWWQVAKKRKCNFCISKTAVIDYKNVDLLRKYISDRGKILPRRMNKNCSKHQHMLANAIKRARNLALLPFTID